MPTKTVLITGAGRGLGVALSAAYAEGGDTVIGTARNPGAGLLPLDVADPAANAALAQTLAGRPIDILICNAGILPDSSERLDNGYPAEMWADGFATNVTGVFLTIQALLPNLRAAGDAKIAIISSQMASSTIAGGGSYIYRASKAAVLNLGRNLATDLKRDGIAVGIYHPGWVQSDMGGPSASLPPATAAAGLRDRIAALSVKTTGVFETWDGRAHPL